MIAQRVEPRKELIELFDQMAAHLSRRAYRALLRAAKRQHSCFEDMSSQQFVQQIRRPEGGDVRYGYNIGSRTIEEIRSALEAIGI